MGAPYVGDVARRAVAVSLRDRAWRVATGATAIVRRLGHAGLYDLGPIGTVFMPALHRNGEIDIDRLLSGAEDSSGTYLARRPRSLSPLERFDNAFEPSPLPARRSVALDVEQARLVGPIGAMINPANGRLYIESSSGRPAQTRKDSTFRRLRLLAPRDRRPGPLVFLPSYDAKNYFHFVSDVLTRLYAFSDDGAADLSRFRENVADLEFVLDEAGPPWQRAYLELLGLRIVMAPLSTRTNWLVDQLVFPTFAGLAHPRFGASLFPAEALHWLRRALREAAEVGDTRDSRLYVTRLSAPTRRVANEPEIERLLAGRGFRRVVPDELSVVDQVRTFAAAEAIVAPHGAGLTNILYASPIPVVELVSPLHVVPCFYLLGEPLGHDYWYVVGSKAVRERDDFTADYTIDAGLLARTLDEAGV
jgi:capsular polysaccharide biosynthesis protein